MIKHFTAASQRYYTTMSDAWHLLDDQQPFFPCLSLCMCVSTIPVLVKDVKRSLKIQSLNKTLQFICRPFDIHLSPALC